MFIDFAGSYVNYGKFINVNENLIQLLKNNNVHVTYNINYVIEWTMVNMCACY